MKGFVELSLLVLVIGSISAQVQTDKTVETNTNPEIAQLKVRLENLYGVLSQLEMRVATIGTYKPVACPAGYIEFQGSCYMFVRSLKNWNDAQKNCQNHEGNLVTIQSAAEQDFISSYARQNKAQFPGSGFWTGAYDTNGQGLFRWIKNKKLIQNEADFLGWDYFDSGHAQSGQDCMAMWKSKDYLWHDWECRNKAHSVCEWEEPQ